MFLSSLKTVTLGCFEIFLLAALGFFLVRKKAISDDALNALSRIVIEFTLPAFIFVQFIKNFRFSWYPKWWIFPVLSLLMTLAGFLLGILFLKFKKGITQKREFMSLIAFQNSGYLPLSLIATILPDYRQGTMFIYLFLFLAGFNLTMWSLGVWFLSRDKGAGFKIVRILSPPVIATLAAFLLIVFGVEKFVPQTVLRPVKLLGDCTVPLAMMIVGGSLARIDIRAKGNWAVILNAALVKLIIMPVIFLGVIFIFNLGPAMGLLLIMEAAMPSATSLVLINRHYGLKEEIINQGVFFSHFISIITIPLFISLFWILMP